METVSYYKRRYYERKEKGICVVCGKEKAREGRTKCEACGERDGIEAKTFRHWLKENGLCTVCGKVKTYGYESICFGCREKARKRKVQVEKRRVWDTALRNKRIEDGICVQCGQRKPETGKTMCRICLNKKLEQYYKKRFTEDGYVPKQNRVEMGLCYFCGQPQEDGYKTCKRCHERMKQMNAKLPRPNNEYWRRQDSLIFAKGGTRKWSEKNFEQGECN